MGWEDLERHKLHDPRKPFVLGRTARYWSSHSTRLLHQWWCSTLMGAPGVAPEPSMEAIEPHQIVTVVGYRRLCGWCFPRKDQA